ncbi:MAG TPA: hypothetical protein VMN78_13595 [Longimicrobiales bacterium]|nr:hypothetical protein [Longimicrobiales bacterium]
MTRRAVRRAVPLLAILAIAGCAYFNALYNARRLYDVAEAAADRGDIAAAEAAHRESLEKAARSLERDPDGRWADDALLLVGQNQFALGDCRAAEAALGRVLRETSDAEVAARARAYIGAARYCLEEPADAAAMLDQSLARLERGTAIEGFARLWRARARFELGQTDSAWADLSHAAAREDALGRAAALEQIGRAIEHDRPALAIDAFHRLLADPAGDLHSDSIARLADAVAARWGGAQARAALEPAPRAPWAGEVRDELVVERARHAAAAGDTALALQELEHAATRSADAAANSARELMARLLLAAATEPAHLTEVRRVLLPALARQRVRPLIHSIGLVETLLDQAQRGQPLALFGAAEVARDRLGAHALARALFIGYAEMAGGGPWSTKARLAALQLDPTPEQAAALRERIAAAGDPYAVAARGSAAAGYEESEARLDQALRGLIERAGRATEQRDLAVGEAIANLDSLTMVARADSLRLTCGLLADSLGLAGIRRDSVNAACLREDLALVDSFLAVDTTSLRDTIPDDRVLPPQPGDSVRPAVQ